MAKITQDIPILAKTKLRKRNVGTRSSKMSHVISLTGTHSKIRTPRPPSNPQKKVGIMEEIFRYDSHPASNEELESNEACFSGDTLVALP